jgi:protease-4
MWATLFKNPYYAIHYRFAAEIIPHLKNAYASGQPLVLPKSNRLKSVQSNISDEDGNMIPFVIKAHGDFSADVSEGKSRSNSSQSKTIQIIPLRGVMQKDGDFCSYGTKDVKAWIDQANGDPNIDAIVLLVDSPGGSVDGTEELAQAVRDSAKPIVSFVDGLAASAAVWVSSQTKDIVISQETTAWYGSIGVFATIINASEAYKKEGFDVQIVRDRTSPNKAKPNSLEPLDEQTRSELEDDLDNIKSTFKGYVTSGRGERLKDGDHFSGNVWNGKEAVKRGLVDKVGTLQDAVNMAAKHASQQSSNQSNSNKKKMKLNATSSPLLASAMGIAAEAGETELSEQHIAAAEAALAANAEAVNERDAAQTALALANGRATDAETKFSALEKEATELRQWRADLKNFQKSTQDVSDQGEEKKPVGKHNAAASEAYAKAKARKDKQKAE